jgi:hypothetical protein
VSEEDIRRAEQAAIAALYAAALLVPAADFDPFIHFARQAALCRLAEDPRPFDLATYFRELVEVYLMRFYHSGRIIH